MRFNKLHQRYFGIFVPFISSLLFFHRILCSSIQTVCERVNATKTSWLEHLIIKTYFDGKLLPYNSDQSALLCVYLSAKYFGVEVFLLSIAKLFKKFKKDFYLMSC